jgi:ribosomal protein L18E
MTEYHHSDRVGDARDTFSRWAESDHANINRVRQAAEALFLPKRQDAELPTPAAALPADQTARKPRILSAVRARPTSAAPIETAVNHVQPKPREKIQPLHLARIRTWLKYGMTVVQVAEVYGVTVADIEGALQRA